MILFILTSFFLQQTWAMEPRDVWHWPQCKGQRSQWSAADIADLKETQQFFSPVDPLSRFSVGIEKLAAWNQSQSTCTKNPTSPFGGINKQPHSAAILVDDIQKKMTAQIQKDLKVQENMIDNGILCTGTEVPANLKSKCDEYLKVLLPDLQDRLQTMRVMKSLAEENVEPQHDRPFSSGLYAQFYPSLWKKGAVKKLRPLNDDELKRRSEFASKKVNRGGQVEALYSPEEAEKVYYSLLSTTPILLFFNEEVTVPGLHEALKNLKAQNAFDAKENLLNPKQELFMMEEYVQKAISELPPGQKGDACRVVGEIYRNLKIQYETFPTYTGGLLTLMSLTAAPVTVLPKVAVKGFTLLPKVVLKSVSSKLTAAGMGVTGSITYANFETYKRGVQYCSTQFMTDKTLSSKVCEFKGLNSLYGDLQTGAAVSGGMGAFALVRMVRAISK